MSTEERFSGKLEIVELLVYTQTFGADPKRIRALDEVLIATSNLQGSDVVDWHVKDVSIEWQIASLDTEQVGE